MMYQFLKTIPTRGELAVQRAAERTAAERHLVLVHQPGAQALGARPE